MNTENRGPSAHTYECQEQTSKHRASPQMSFKFFPKGIHLHINSRGGGTYYISRSQLPLVPAYAYTANKIQGQSLKYALINLKSARGTQALYVMISRAISLENLAIMCWFPSTNLHWRLSPAYRNEFERLEKLDERTTAEYKKRKWQATTYRTATTQT
jgi:hypothetical protein